MVFLNGLRCGRLEDVASLSVLLVEVFPNTRFVQTHCVGVVLDVELFTVHGIDSILK